MAWRRSSVLAVPPAPPRGQRGRGDQHGRDDDHHHDRHYGSG
jgi:hypothetical protein